MVLEEKRLFKQEQIIAAGDTRLPSKKIRVKETNLHIWFATTGQKNKAIKKVGKGSEGRGCEFDPRRVCGSIVFMVFGLSGAKG